MGLWTTERTNIWEMITHALISNDPYQSADRISSLDKCTALARIYFSTTVYIMVHIILATG